MKHLIFSFVFVLLACQCFAQTPLTRKEELWQKSKHQKTIGFVLLGAGAVATIIGLAIVSSHGAEDFANLLFNQKNTFRGAGVFATGVIVMAGSIPFFIMSGHNRKLSLRLTSSRKILPNDFQRGWTYQSKPALELKFTQTIF